VLQLEGEAEGLGGGPPYVVTAWAVAGDPKSFVGEMCYAVSCVNSSYEIPGAL